MGYKMTDKLEPGDVIFVQRTASDLLNKESKIGNKVNLYRHFAVYVGDGKVIHYAPKAGKDFKKGEHATIHEAPFSEFIGNESNFYIMDFPEKYGEPQNIKVVGGSFALHASTTNVSMGASLLAIGIKEIVKLTRSHNYFLYSPKETIKRAYSRAGEAKYNLASNNCEHFAVWCKTGLKQSRQVDNVINILCGNAIPITNKAIMF